MDIDGIINDYLLFTKYLANKNVEKNKFPYLCPPDFINLLKLILLNRCQIL